MPVFSSVTYRIQPCVNVIVTHKKFCSVGVRVPRPPLITKTIGAKALIYVTFYKFVNHRVNFPRRSEKKGHIAQISTSVPLY